MQQAKKSLPSWQFIFIRFLSFLLLLYFLFLAGRMLFKNQRIKNEIAMINAEIKKQEQKNEELRRLIEYQKSEAFKEKQLRQKLGYKKEGEIVIVIPENQDKNSPEPEITPKSSSSNLGVPNYILWWRYLSGK